MSETNIPAPKKKFLSLQLDPNLFNKATDEEKAQADVMGESSSFFKDGMRKLMKNPLAVGSIIVLIVIILLVIFVPIIVPYKYDEIIRVNGMKDATMANLAPFAHSRREQAIIDAGGSVFPHIMGTDSLGRDYFVRVIQGTKISLAVGIVAALLVLIIGVIYGSIAGFKGGKVDMIMMRIVDIIYSLPDVLMIILLSVVLNQTLDKNNPIVSALGTNMVAMFLVFGLLYWVGMARLVRGEILQIKNNDYVLAARATGAGDAHIIKTHIIPNCISVIIITTALEIPSAIFTESYLSFMGLGVQAPMPSLGSLANSAREGLQSYPWQLIFPSVMIILIVLAFNLLGDGLRDAFDPKLRR